MRHFRVLELVRKDVGMSMVPSVVTRVMQQEICLQEMLCLRCKSQMFQDHSRNTKIVYAVGAAVQGSPCAELPMQLTVFEAARHSLSRMSWWWNNRAPCLCIRGSSRRAVE